MTDDIITLESDRQHLQLAPALGGAVTAWGWRTPEGWTPLFRPWDGKSEDRYTLACFPLVPWSNRITQRGFEHDDAHYPLRPNRINERYPIHGDGWLQQWEVAEREHDRIKLALTSTGYSGNPYRYRSTQNFTLLPNGLAIDLSVTHLGEGSLPYGLGLHPYFTRNEKTRLQMHTTGLWQSGDDPIPVHHTTTYPPGWDYNKPAHLEGELIDNCFTGWDGKAVIQYPDRGLTITMSMADCNGYSLFYRPPDEHYFCLEPITHPIDAFHMEGRPGLVVLRKGETFTLRATFLVN
jgi:aldose 1-epimerase